MVAIFCNVGYSSDLYEEVTNVRSFGKASLWGSIGGFVGMILGLSLFQLPDIFTGGVDYMQKKTLRQKERQDSGHLLLNIVKKHMAHSRLVPDLTSPLQWVAGA